VLCVTPVGAIKKKYGSRAGEILKAIGVLGSVVDATGMGPTRIQAKIASLSAAESICLIGSYDLLPPFSRKNPTSHLSGDTDGNIKTDAPYGAPPGSIEDEYAPPRVPARMPDGADVDADRFLKLLTAQRAAPRRRTPTGAFEEAANEFAGAARYVHRALSKGGVRRSVRLSPPCVITRPDPVPLLSRRGRAHILLHGADFSPDWASLFGRKESDPPNEYPEALSASLIERCDLQGSVVTFSSCYAAMLDGGSKRTPANQVALACLASGAKVVLCSTRSNWIQTMRPFSGFGPGLVAEFWKELRKPHRRAADALTRAKRTFLKAGLAGDPADHPYILKTVLQAHLYGHPDARL
jgi:hypothetical protein